MNALQTNGLHREAAWCRCLREHGFLVGVSFDGPRELNDAYRVDRPDRGTYERVLAWIRQLQAHGVAFNVLRTVHAANACHGRRVYQHLRDEVGARHLQCVPIVERLPAGSGRGLSPVTPRSVDGGSSIGCDCQVLALG